MGARPAGPGPPVGARPCRLGAILTFGRVQPSIRWFNAPKHAKCTQSCRPRRPTGPPRAGLLARDRYPARLVDRTLVICKPDAVERGLTGEIIGRLERKGLRLVAAELRTLDRGVAGRHYAEHQGKDFYEGLLGFITRSPVLLLVVAGPEDTWQVVRTLMGATNPAAAAPGTIRGDLALETTENLVHGSDSAASAAREIALFFPGLE